MAAATFAFGQNKTTGLATTNPGFSFGTPSASSSIFGGAKTTTSSTAAPGFSFGAPAASSSVFGAKTTASTGTTGLTSFGGLSTTKPATLSGFGQTSTASTGGLSFGTGLGTASNSLLAKSNVQTVTPSGSATLFSSVPQKTTATGFLGQNTAPLKLSNLSSTNTTTGLFGGGLGSTSTAAPAATSITGLGGTGTVLAGTGSTSEAAGKASEIQNLKDNQVPKPLIQVVEDMKKYVKQQKENRNEIARFSVSNIQKVQEETGALKQSLSVVSNSIQRDACAVENLKMDVAQDLKNAEIAQHTSEILPALQHENIAPQEYFARLVDSFEERMQLYRKQIEIMESHLASLSQGQVLTPQDLSLVMHKVHSTFIALASQLHGIHEAVKLQKEHYLNYRKAYFKDNTDIFTRTSRISTTRPSMAVVGPSPFSNAPSSGLNSTLGTKLQTTGLGTTGLNTTGNRLGMSSGLGTSFGGSTLGTTFGTPGTSGLGAGFKPLGTQTAGTSTAFGVANQANKTIGFGAPNAALGSSFGAPSTALGSAFGTPSTTGSTFGTLSKFELQKPPAGNKRGKKK